MRGVDRRTFLAAGAWLLVVPHAAGAQGAQGVHRIGFVSPTGPGVRNEALLRGLRELGYVEGRNLAIAMRFAEGRPERLPGLVDELIRLGIDVLVVGSTVGARAAKAATTTLPVVFAGSSDPVAGNIVKTLARPGGNLTGTSLAYGDGIAGKWLELLVEMAHAVSPCSVLWSSSNTAGARFVEELRAAARKLDVRLDPHHATNVGELDEALVAVRSSGARSLIVTPSPFWAAHQRRLLRLAEDHRLPTMHFDEDFVGAGGLMSYGPSIAEAYRRAATHVDRILRGANAGDLPVEQPTQFDLVVNARTAKALGLTVTQPMLIRARVIE